MGVHIPSLFSQPRRMKQQLSQESDSGSLLTVTIFKVVLARLFVNSDTVCCMFTARRRGCCVSQLRSEFILQWHCAGLGGELMQSSVRTLMVNSFTEWRFLENSHLLNIEKNFRSPDTVCNRSNQNCSFGNYPSEVGEEMLEYACTLDNRNASGKVSKTTPPQNLCSS